MKEVFLLELDRNKLIARFTDYISYNTQSNEENDQVCPSTPSQLVLARHLEKELKNLGLEEIMLDKNGYIMATLPSNGGEGPVIGFISHMDTSPDAPGGPIHPRIVENYDGKDILLNKEKISFFHKRFSGNPEIQGSGHHGHRRDYPSWL